MHDPIRFSQDAPGGGGPSAGNQPPGDGQRQRTGGSSNKTLWIILALVGALLLMGCCCTVPVLIGLLVPAVAKVRMAAERAVQLNELSEVGKAIHSFYEGKKQMPANVDDLMPFLSSPKTKEDLRKGAIEVVWNAVSFKEEDRGTSNVMIGWFTKPAVDGQRLVLLMDGSARAMSPDDFRNTPKVRKKAEK